MTVSSQALDTPRLHHLQAADEHFAPRTNYLFELWSAFARHRLLAVLIVGTVMGLAVAALFFVPPQYQATSQVMIEARNSEVIKMDAVLSRMPSDFDSISSELQVLQSRDMLEELVGQLHLDAVDELDPNAHRRSDLLRPLSPELAAWAAAWIDRPALEKQERVNAVVDAVRAHLNVAPIGRSRVISITYTSRYPDIAANVVNTLAQMYIDRQTEIKEAATKTANAWISGQLAGLRDKAQEAGRRVERFRNETGLIQGANDTTLIRQYVGELNSELTTAMAARLEAAAKRDIVRRAAASQDNASTDVLGSRLIQQLRSQQAQLAADYATAHAINGEKNPQLLGLTAAMADLQKRIDGETRKIVASVEGDYEAALGRENALRQKMDAAKAQIAGLTEPTVRLNELEQEAQADRALYDSFLQRYKETSLEKTYQVPDALVVSHAAVPLRPFFPNGRILLPVAFVMSSLFTLLVLLIVERRDRGFHSRAQIEHELGLPAIGIMPELSRGDRQEGDMPDPMSIMGSVLTDLYLRAVRDGAPKSLLVASALPMEGKTTLSLCLARMAASQGRKVLFIDADLRCSGLCGRFKQYRGPGLADVLDRSAALDDVLHPDSVVDGLMVIGCGRPVRNPATVLSGGAMQQLIDVAKSTFDLVIIDSPAIMAGPDAWLLSQFADETVLFVRWRHTPRHVVRAALKVMAGAGARISGVVLTIVNLRRIGGYSSTDAISYSKVLRRHYRSAAA